MIRRNASESTFARVRPLREAWVPPAEMYWFVNVPAIGGLPMVSDVAIARETGGTWTRDGETFLQITPAHINKHDGSIHAYLTGRIGRHYLRLDLADASPGQYSLALRVQDVDTRAYSLPAVTEIFVPEAPTGR